MARRGLVLRSLLAVVLAAGLVAVAEAPAGADTDAARKKAADRRVSQLQGALRRTEAQEVGAAAALQRAQAALVAAQRKAAAADRALAASRKQEELLAAQELAAQQAVEQGMARIEATRAHMARTRDAVGQVARSQYISGGQQPLQLVDVLLDSSDITTYTRAQEMARAVSAKEQAVIRQLALQRAQLALEQQRLDAEKARATGLHQQAAAQVATSQKLAREAASARAAVAALTAQRARALADVRAQRAAEQDALAAAQRQSATIAARIAAEQRRVAALLAARRKAAATGRRSGGFAGPSSSGSLQWPVAGGLVGGVGPRTNPATGGLSCHAGIDISAGYGTPIHAADDGQVIDEFYSPWDGNVTVVAHAGGLATWYAHQSSRAVGVGASVNQGQVIGYVGATGFATGPHLHFNVTVNGTLYDPMGWFGGSQRAVAPLCSPPYPQPVA
ncbi:MAG: M23 family metallopeptidase [Motilibacteraceae bacterium]